MCIRDSVIIVVEAKRKFFNFGGESIVSKSIADCSNTYFKSCLLYTSDAADERSSVDLGGRRIIKKKKIITLSLQTISNIKRHNIYNTHYSKQHIIQKNSTHII